MLKLIKACQINDYTAQKELYMLHVDRLYFVLNRYIKDVQETENLLQDVFLIIFNKINTFDANKGSFNTWSSTIAIRLALNFCKKRSIDYVSMDEVELIDSTVLDDNIQALEAEYLINIITSLDENYRMVFNLYEIDGYDHNEIANMLDISPSTSRSTLSRAKFMIRKKIADNKIQIS